MCQNAQSPGDAELAGWPAPRLACRPGGALHTISFTRSRVQWCTSGLFVAAAFLLGRAANFDLRHRLESTVPALRRRKNSPRVRDRASRRRSRAIDGARALRAPQADPLPANQPELHEV